MFTIIETVKAAALPQAPTLSVVIPAFNEEARLPATLDRIRGYLQGAGLGPWEVIVCDDGSTDGTAQMVTELMKADAALRLISYRPNRGKGYAVRQGMLAAQGQWRLLTDADLSAPIEDLQRLLEAAHREHAQIVIGSRALDRSLIGVHQPVAREYAGRLFNLAVRWITGLPFRDTQCGFKLFAAAAAQIVFSRQQLEGFGFDVEVLYIGRLHGLKILEVPVHWNNVEGTKVSLLRGVDSFLDLLRIRRHAARGAYR